MPRTLLPLLLSCSGRCAEEPALPRAPRAIIVVLDGARLDETLGAGDSSVAGTPTADVMPHLSSDIAADGAVVLPGHATGITITAPGHCDLLTGRRQVFANYALTAEGVGAYRPALPTLFEAALAQGAAADEVSLIVNTTLLEPLARSSYPGDGGGAAVQVLQNGQAPDKDVLSAARDAIREDRPRLLVMNLHDADRGGHYGDDDDYLQALQRADGGLAEFWAWVQEQPSYGEDALLVVVADHGRHRNDVEDSWRQHGDQCEGCREVPLLLAGPGVRRGAVIDTPATLEDVAQTVAAHLGVDLPYGEGRVIAEAFDDPPAQTRALGRLRPARAGGALALEERLDDAGQRSRIVLDETVFEGAFLAEDPRAAAGAAAAYACWRELPAPNGRWEARCAEDPGDGWAELPSPHPGAVSPLWAPAMAIDAEDRLWMGVVDNANGVVATDGNTPIQVALRLWDGGTWHAVGAPLADVIFPSDPALALDPEPLLAFGTSDPDDAGRYTRRIEVHRLADGAWTEDLALRPQEDGVSVDRLELPALWADESLSLARLAFVGFTAAGEVSLWETERADGAWGPASPVDGGRVLGHLAPAYGPDGALWWARLSAAGTVEICRSDAEITCQDTGAAAIEGLSVDAAGATAGLRDAGGDWALAELAL